MKKSLLTIVKYALGRLLAFWKWILSLHPLILFTFCVISLLITTAIVISFLKGFKEPYYSQTTVFVAGIIIALIAITSMIALAKKKRFVEEL